MKRTMILTVLLISLLAVCAYAQADGDKGENANQGETAMDRQHGDGIGNNYELGNGHRKGDDYAGETGPHGDPQTEPAPLPVPRFVLTFLEYGGVLILAF